MIELQNKFLSSIIFVCQTLNNFFCSSDNEKVKRVGQSKISFLKWENLIALDYSLSGPCSHEMKFIKLYVCKMETTHAGKTSS